MSPKVGLPFSSTEWLAKHANLTAAIALSDIVALVGPKGSGKTYALQMLAQAAPPGTAKVRNAGEARLPDVTLDLVDGLDAVHGFAGKMVVAIGPNELTAFQLVHPDAPVVKLRPMSRDEVHEMLKVRWRQFGILPGAITLRAQTALERRCGGHPGALDLLIRMAYQAAKTDKVPRISADHVERAWTELKASIIRPRPGTMPLEVAASEPTPTPDPPERPVAAVQESQAPVGLSAWETLNAPLEMSTASRQSTRQCQPQQAFAGQRSRRRHIGSLAVALAIVVLVAAMAPRAVVSSTVVKLQFYADTALASARHYVTALDDAQPTLLPPNHVFTPSSDRVVQQAPQQPSVMIALPAAAVSADAYDRRKAAINPLQALVSMEENDLARSAYVLLRRGASPSLSNVLSPPAMYPSGVVTPVLNVPPELAPVVKPDLASNILAILPRPTKPQVPANQFSIPPDLLTSSQQQPTQVSAAMTMRAAHLVGLGRALVSIGEIDDAKEMFEAAAQIGSAEAKVAYRTLVTPGTGMPSSGSGQMRGSPEERRSGMTTHAVIPPR